jgi:CheY-like chemotaxis protein
MFGGSVLQRSKTILIVEDKQFILNAIRHLLKPAGYCVLESRSPREALQISNRHDYDIDLLLTDIVLPGLYGSELAELMKLDYPQLRVLYIAGGCEDYTPGLLDASGTILRKPFRSHDVVRTVRKALDEHFCQEGFMAVKSKTQLIVLGVGTGFVIGLSAGLLFAPTNGEKTRRLLWKEARKGRHYLTDVRDSASEIAKKMTVG